MTEAPRTEAQMRQSAELVVDTCFEVTDGDVVTIITDDRRKPEAEMVATVVAERGGLPIVANNEAQIRRALADTLFPMVPPRNLHQAMVTSDQIIIMTNLEWANRFAHVLPGGSWSRVLVADKTVGGNASALGYSVFKPGTSTADLSHAVEELAYIVSGRGVIRLETGDVPVAAGQALYVPAKVWHTVVNPGAEDLVMVFSFPSPDYPPTERREPR